MAEKSFENSMGELEEIVNKLEDGKVELSDALDLFEKGVVLSKKLTKALEEAEQKVTKLSSEDDGKITDAPFDASEE